MFKYSLVKVSKLPKDPKIKSQSWLYNGATSYKILLKKLTIICRDLYVG